MTAIIPSSSWLALVALIHLCALNILFLRNCLSYCRIRYISHHGFCLGMIISLIGRVSDIGLFSNWILRNMSIDLIFLLNWVALRNSLSEKLNLIRVITKRVFSLQGVVTRIMIVDTEALLIHKVPTLFSLDYPVRRQRGSLGVQLGLLINLISVIQLLWSFLIFQIVHVINLNKIYFVI